MSHLPRSTWLVVGVLALSGSALWAQDVSGAGSFPFYGTARTIGLAGAFTGVADDTGGLHWNPAGMAQLKERAAEGTFKLNTGGPNYYHVAYIQPMTADVKFGGGFSLLHAKDATGRSDMAAQYTYGQWFRERELAFGANIRYHTAKAAGTSGSNISVDFGTLYTPLRYRHYTFGLVALDINEPTFKGIGRAKRVFNAGIGWRPDHNTLIAADWYDIASMAHRGQLKLGVERTLTQNMTLRAGVAEKTFGVGLGLAWHYLKFDFGFQRIKGQSDLNAISLGSSF